MEDFICTIEARTSSSRLPRKVLLKNHGRTMLEIMIERVKKVSRISKIIIATTSDPSDDEIENVAKKIGVNCYRGSIDDVYSRVLNAAKEFKAKNIVALTGDCPLIDSKLIDHCIDDFIKLKPDYLSNALIRELPDGMDCQVLSFKCLESINSEKLTKLDREHVTLYIRKNPKKFKLHHVKENSSFYWPELGLTLDEKEDFVLISKILDNFYPNLNFSLQEIIEYLKKNVNLISINSNVNRKGDS